MAFNGILPLTSFVKIRRRVQKLKFTHTHTHTHDFTKGLLHSRRPTTVVLRIESRLRCFGIRNLNLKPATTGYYHNDLVNISTVPIVKITEQLRNFWVSFMRSAGRNGETPTGISLSLQIVIRCTHWPLFAMQRSKVRHLC